MNDPFFQNSTNVSTNHSAMIGASIPIVIICLGRFILKVKKKWTCCMRPLYQQLRDTNDTNILKECSICLNTKEDDHIYVICKCDHIFHKECIDKWIVKERSCPNCRITLI